MMMTSSLTCTTFTPRMHVCVCMETCTYECMCICGVIRQQTDFHTWLARTHARTHTRLIVVTRSFVRATQNSFNCASTYMRKCQSMQCGRRNSIAMRATDRSIDVMHKQNLFVWCVDSVSTKRCVLYDLLYEWGRSIDQSIARAIE